MRAYEATLIEGIKIKNTVVEHGLVVYKKCYGKDYSLSYFKFMRLYKFQKIIQHKYTSTSKAFSTSVLYRVRTKKETLSNPPGYNKEGAYITHHKLFEEKIFNHMFTIISSQAIKKTL